jgi:hypothetical protein
MRRRSCGCSKEGKRESLTDRLSNSKWSKGAGRRRVRSGSDDNAIPVAFRKRLALTLAALVIPLSLAACMGEDDSSGGSTNPSDTTKSGTNPRITIDDSDCVYDGDTTPKALTFMVDVDNYATTYARVELDRIPTNVTNEEVEAFFEEAQQVLAQGGEFAGPPQAWRLINGGGFGDGTSTGSMRLGTLMPGQRYVLWCSTGEPTEGSPPDAIFFATVLEPNE